MSKTVSGFLVGLAVIAGLSVVDMSTFTGTSDPNPKGFSENFGGSSSGGFAVKPGGGGGGPSAPPVVRRSRPNDYWANNTFVLNTIASDDSRPLSDGAVIGGQGYDQDTWAVWWTRDDFIDLGRAWAITTGDTNIVIAQSDVEINFAHYDLQPNLMRNWGEHGGVAGVDDDGNGLIDDIKGWDFDHWDNNPAAPVDDIDAMSRWMQGSSTQHGTNMAGLIAAKGNNEPWGRDVNHTDHRPGTVGVLWDARVYPLRCLGNGLAEFSNSPHELVSSGLYGILGNSNQHVEYMCWLKDEGIMDIRVLSMSWVRQSRYLVSRCLESGILPVTGAGNGVSEAGLNPIATISDSILVMGGVNAVGRALNGANFGPGVRLSGWTDPPGSHAHFDITSWSAPIPDGTYGFLPMDPGYGENVEYFSTGFMSRLGTEGVNLNVDWEPNFLPTESLPDYTVQYGVIPSAMHTSGATAEGAGVAMLLFSAYPELGPLQCMAMMERGASRFIYDGRNVVDCDSGDCAGKLGAGAMNAYRSLTLWGAVSDTTFGGVIYVSGDVVFGANVIIEDDTVFRVSPEDIYTNEIDDGGFLQCQDQYEITDVFDNEPADLTETTEIFVTGNVVIGSNVIFESFAQIPGPDDWGGIWVQVGGDLDDSNYITTGTMRGD